ncbi:Lcl domain-containing protein, partial [Acinetobacter junii]|uniref:Lcl domain-containing protein n=1 Tax=Acinetobacter junii TaxID=40215 RepID=UPI00124C41B5
MSQSFETFVPTLKHQKLLATAEAIALEKDKAEDAKTLKQATEDAVKYFEQYRYWWINEGEMIFDRETGLLWQGKLSDMTYCYDEQQQANQNLLSLKLGGLNDWRIPLDAELWKIVEPTTFPLKNGEYLRLQDYQYLLTQNNHLYDLNSSDSRKIIITSGGYSYRSNYKRGKVIAVNSFIQQKIN